MENFVIKKKPTFTFTEAQIMAIGQRIKDMNKRYETCKRLSEKRLAMSVTTETVYETPRPTSVLPYMENIISVRHNKASVAPPAAEEPTVNEDDVIPYMKWSPDNMEGHPDVMWAKKFMLGGPVNPDESDKILIHKGLFAAKVDVWYYPSRDAVVKGPFKTEDEAKEVAARQLNVFYAGSKIVPLCLASGKYVCSRPLLNGDGPVTAMAPMFRKAGSPCAVHVTNCASQMRRHIMEKTPARNRISEVKKLITKEVVRHHILVLAHGYGDQGVNNLVECNGQVYGLDLDNNRVPVDMSKVNTWDELLFTSRLGGNLKKVMSDIYSHWSPIIVTEMRDHLQTLPYFQYINEMMLKK